MIVLDASAAVEIILRTPDGDAASTRYFAGEPPLCAPHLLDLEVAQVLRRYVLQGKVDADRAQQALADFESLPLERYPHRELLDRIWELRHNLTSYDAAYVALTEALGATLLTRDGRIQRASGHTAKVEVF